jgi:hypothetical protein
MTGDGAVVRLWKDGRYGPYVADRPERHKQLITQPAAEHNAAIRQQAAEIERLKNVARELLAHDGGDGADYHAFKYGEAREQLWLLVADKKRPAKGGTV